MELNSSLIMWEGKPAALCLATDITARKEADSALRESEQKYRLIIDKSPVGIIHFDSNGIITECNQATQEIFGSSKAAIIGFSLTTSLKNEKVIEAVQAALSGQTGCYEGEYTSITGNRNSWLNLQYTPLIGIDSSVIGGIGILQDITQRKYSEKTLLENERRFRLLFEEHDAVMLLIEPDSGVILDANQAAANYYGYPLETLRKMNIEHINCLRPEEVLAERQKAKLETRNHFLFPHRLSTGEIRTVEVYSSLIELRGQSLLFSIVHDITEAQQGKEALAQKTALLSGLVDSTPDMGVL